MSRAMACPVEHMIPSLKNCSGDAPENEVSILALSIVCSSHRPVPLSGGKASAMAKL
jgi:hypothetical protein